MIEDFIDIFILFIIIIKILFICLSIFHVISVHSKHNKYESQLLFWKQKTEFIFIISMSILLIYFFNPFGQKTIMHKKTKLLFFLFGIILLITADWKDFIHNQTIITNY